MAKKKVEEGPSKKDLHDLVKGLTPRYGSDDRSSAPLKKAQAAADAAKKAYDEAYHRIIKQNPELKELDKARKKAGSKASRMEKIEREKRSKECRDCFNAIRLDGASPEVVRRVRALINKYDRPNPVE